MQKPIDTRTFDHLVDRIRPILAGHDPAIQSAVLADLLSMWLAGHFLADSGDDQAKFREELLANHMQLVRDLIPANEAMIVERTRK